MSITLGIFDVFAYAVPGSLYLTLMTYLAARFNWIQLAELTRANTTLLFLVGALLSYLIGHVSYPAGGLLRDGIRAWQRATTDAREEFLRRVPAAVGRPFVDADRSILLAAVEVRSHPVALEIHRLRAVGLMLRNCTPAFLLGGVVAAAEIGLSRAAGPAVSCLLLLMVAAAGSTVQSRRLSHWANLKTLEVAFWIPGIDDELRAAAEVGGAFHDPADASRRSR